MIMNFRLFIFTFLFFYSFNTFSQSIITNLRRGPEYTFRGVIPVVKYKEKSILYGRSGRNETRTETHFLNEKQMPLQGENYFLERDLRGTYANEYLNDSILIKRTTTQQGRYVKFFKRIVVYSYDPDDFLIEQSIIEGPTDIYKTIKYINDDRGNPIRLTIDDGQYGYETSQYNYINNTAQISTYDNNNNLLSTSSILINRDQKDANNQYNEYGDIIESKNYKFKYKYDKNHNWIKRTRFSKSDKIKEAVFTRKIFYRD